MKYIVLFCSALLNIMLASSTTYAQKDRDVGEMIEYKNEFWEKIKESVKDFEKEEEEPNLRFKMDFSDYDLPDTTTEFKSRWHNDPVKQGWSGMCWCYSTTSLLESELKRIHGKEMKFSEIHTVYWEYVEKARRFIRERGDSYFAQGSEANAVIRIWKKYGCVPHDQYTGLKPGQEFHGHSKMFKEMKTYLESVKKMNAWNEEENIATIKSIMNHYIGKPPEHIINEDAKYTPKAFLEQVVKLNPDDYVDIMSVKEKPYWEKAEYDVPDNWWHSERYNNVPLDEFMSAIKEAVNDGYTLFIGGDVSETGYNSHKEVAMVPSYDIPSEYIDENARQFRFSNGSTTDDHGIHLVGWAEKDNGTWFLIKDSGSGSRNGPNKGYYFYHQDYVKLKMMNSMVHKSAVEDLLKKVKISKAD